MYSLGSFLLESQRVISELFCPGHYPLEPFNQLKVKYLLASPGRKSYHPTKMGIMEI